MDNEKINELYDAMLNSADIATSEDIKENCTLEELDEIMSTPSSDNPNNGEGEKAISQYNSITGDQAVIDQEYSLQSISDQNFISFTASQKDQEINWDILKKMIDSEKDVDDMITITTITDMIKRWHNGERFNPYDKFPEEFKKRVDEMIIQAQQPMNSTSRAFVSKAIISDLEHKYYKDINATMDIELMLSGFDKDVEKFTNESAKEVGNLMLSYDEQRKVAIDAAIEKCKTEGKEDAIQKFEDMKNAIDESSNLNNFSEFCKTVKIKKFDLEKPSRIFDQFNAKYYKHKYNINDISMCPGILDRHFVDHLMNLKICVAFCKYCLNKNPDNITDHTFMYYFIRNIIAMDRLNPKGQLYEGMDDRSKKFYDEFSSALKRCFVNLNR